MKIGCKYSETKSLKIVGVQFDYRIYLPLNKRLTKCTKKYKLPSSSSKFSVAGIYASTVKQNYNTKFYIQVAMLLNTIIRNGWNEI